jgi:hypothetical protein
MSSNNNNNNNTRPANKKEKPSQEEWFNGYKGGALVWGVMRKRASKRRRYNIKDVDMMRHILSTVVSK